jgi:hypothetical protein
LRLVAQRFVGVVVEHLVRVVHLCVVRRVELFLVPSFVLLIHGDFLFSEVPVLVLLLVVQHLRQQGFLDEQEVLCVQDFEQRFVDEQERVE